MQPGAALGVRFARHCVLTRAASGAEQMLQTATEPAWASTNVQASPLFRPSAKLGTTRRHLLELKRKLMPPLCQKHNTLFNGEKLPPKRSAHAAGRPRCHSPCFPSTPGNIGPESWVAAVVSWKETAAAVVTVQSFHPGWREFGAAGFWGLL